MATFTITEFQGIVNACFDGTTAEEIKDSTLHTEFTDLGFDSLTVYEIVTRIQDDYAVTVPDEQLDELTTPAALIQYVQGQLTAV
ncbi:acyl carrier protein [Streptomyces sp. NBC_01352]|uniref:Carrier domain-containing protein n=1 Tax=Streptomyces plumbiresistens TaxID=511811 RepID=A0ABP7QKT6_9ACTN|nr:MULTISPECIES: acyl carrier protein [unclassified Streptomyces]MCX4705767.1 acyl carrier protein [Streptomyces sp. NBC_01373]MDQ1050669.1 act minimal PKS acyl carrier protein [Streptomyces sp. V4I2]